MPPSAICIRESFTLAFTIGAAAIFEAPFLYYNNNSVLIRLFQVEKEKWKQKSKMPIAYVITEHIGKGDTPSS